MNELKKRAAEQAFLGQGWSFPVRFRAAEGCADMVAGVDDIEQSLAIIFNTMPGERATNLLFGSKVKQKIFDPIDSKFSFLAEEAIRDAIDFYEPRIRVDQILLNYEQKADGIVLLELHYTIKQTNARHNLVHPFSELEANL